MTIPQSVITLTKLRVQEVQNTLQDGDWHSGETLDSINKEIQVLTEQRIKLETRNEVLNKELIELEKFLAEHVP